MKLTKPELDELRKLNPPDDPRMFRRFIDTIDSLEAELAAARTEFREALAVRDREIAMLYDNQNAARDREKAAIAAALAKAVDTCVDGAVVAYKRGYKEHGDACHSCASRIRTLITTYQSAARGVASTSTEKSLGSPGSLAEGSART